MQKKNLFRLAIILVALMGSFLALRSSPTPTVKKSTCKASTKPCPIQKRTNPAPSPGGMIWDNLTSQFISIASFH